MLLNFPSHGDAKKRCKVNAFMLAKQANRHQISHDAPTKLIFQARHAIMSSLFII